MASNEVTTLRPITLALLVLNCLALSSFSQENITLALVCVVRDNAEMQITRKIEQLATKGIHIPNLALLNVLSPIKLH